MLVSFLKESFVLVKETFVLVLVKETFVLVRETFVLVLVKETFVLVKETLVLVKETYTHDGLSVVSACVVCIQGGGTQTH